jgi:uncharacterized protein
MFFQLNEIPDGGLHFTEIIKRDQFNIDQADCTLSRNVDVAGFLEKISNDIFFKGKIRTGLNVVCSRCLKTCPSDVEAEVTALFVPHQEGQELKSECELKTSDIDIEYYDDNRIDLTQPIHDQILLALPSVNLCQPGCRGLCPNCGTNLNNEECGCGKGHAIDPRLEILKRLKNTIE